MSSRLRTYEPDDVIECPHCGEKQDDTAKDYVVPFRIMEASKAVTDCHNCASEFSARLNSEEKIEVEPVF